jgi:transposase-like protein
LPASGSIQVETNNKEINMARQYPEAIRKQAVQDILHGKPLSAVAREIGCDDGTVRDWKKKYGSSPAGAADLTGSGREPTDVAGIRRENAELKRQVGVLKEALLVVAGLVP